jgi:hypothetical protein
MINFHTIKQSIIEMEYGWKKPRSLIILVPGLSLIFQKIQVSHLISTLKASYQKPDQFSALLNSREYAKLDTIYKWHTLGSLIQTISLLALTTLNPVFLLPAAFSIYEMYASAEGITHKVIQLDGQPHIVK